MSACLSLRSFCLRGLLAVALLSPLSASAITLTLEQLLLLKPLIDADPELLKEEAQGALICQSTDILKAKLPTIPLYTQQANGCTEINPEKIDTAGTFFTDSQCASAIRFKPTTLAAYCRASLDTTTFGSEGQAKGDTPIWELAVASTLDIGVTPLKDRFQPYLTRRTYKTVSTDQGDCALEMRIYKKDIAASDLKPLLWFHGGSWQYRLSGFLGLESQLSHFTDLGFTVFAPFYRLLGDAEGSPECHGVTGPDIVADANDALDWVLKNASRYGATADKVYVTGQSAGGHLAASLATRRPDKIKRALLMYPPTDFADFLTQYSQGELTDTRGIDTLSEFTGTPLNELNANDPIVINNSFPPIIAQAPSTFPPMFILHGGSDTVVPVRQAGRLCNARSGTPETGPAQDITTDTARALQSFRCDDFDSRLVVATEANHALEVCITTDFSLLPEAFSALCPSGSKAGQEATRAALQQSRSWLVSDENSTNIGTPESGDRTPTDSNPSSPSDSGSSNGGSGGGGSLAWLLLFALAIPHRLQQGR